MLLNNKQAVSSSEKNQKKNKYLETKENGRVTYQNLWDEVKTIPRGKFREINAYLKK